MLSIIADPDYGDITDATGGRDIVVERQTPAEAGNQYGNWTNVTQRNLKGTPADGGNAYYSPYHGIAATATAITMFSLQVVIAIVAPVATATTTSNNGSRSLDNV